MDIDRQRIAAVLTLQSIGNVFQGGEWIAASAASDPAMPIIPVIPEADVMHGLLMRRAARWPAGCTEGSEEEAELKAMVDALEAYETKRWPLGKEPGGKGRSTHLCPLLLSSGHWPMAATCTGRDMQA